MSIMEAQEVIKLVAKNHGVAYEDVIKEIELCITEAMQNPDPLVQERWKYIPRSGKRPTALEFVAFMRHIIHDR